ncbi:MAG: Mov34/MPN/PAD-1 family protein [Myxococcota bacterium]
MTKEHDPPWICGDLEIASAVLLDIEAHAEEQYPSEACGLIFGPKDNPPRLDSFSREINQADALHAKYPEQFPRTSKEYFVMDTQRASSAEREGNKNGRPLKVIYHSHCDAGAYFSEEDAATFSWGGALTYPCSFLVVSVIQGSAVDRKLWCHVAGTDEFREYQLRICTDRS